MTDQEAGTKTPSGRLIPEDELSDPPMVQDGAGTSEDVSHVPMFAEFGHGTLPEWALVRQRMDAPEIADARSAVREALEPVLGAMGPGVRVCIAAGSRGIDRIDEVVRATVERVRETGAAVFIVPAMGSHGAPDDRRRILAGCRNTSRPPAR